MSLGRKEVNRNTIKHLCYKRRVLECRLATLETRRLRGDLIEDFKILNGYEDMDSKTFF